jgi:hypothetical protein
MKSDKPSKEEIECIRMLADMPEEKFEIYIDTIKNAGLSEAHQSTLVTIMQQTFQMAKRIKNGR